MHRMAAALGVPADQLERITGNRRVGDSLPAGDEVWQRRNILGKCPIINFPGKNLNPPAFGRERMGNRVSRFLCKSHIRRQRFIAVNAVWLGFIVGRQFRFLFPQIIINRPEPLIGRPAEGKCFVQSQFFCDLAQPVIFKPALPDRLADRIDKPDEIPRHPGSHQIIPFKQTGPGQQDIGKLRARRHKQVTDDDKFNLAHVLQNTGGFVDVAMLVD